MDLTGLTGDQEMRAGLFAEMSPYIGFARSRLSVNH